MGGPPSQNASARIDQLIDEFVQRLGGDDPLAAEDLVDANPDIAEQLAERLAAAERVLHLAARSSTTGVSTTRADGTAEVKGRADDTFTDEPAVAGYEIIREIHRGGQGVVYLAVQKSTKREVALKLIHHGALATRGDKLRFEREVEILGQLRHPHIVNIHDSGSSAGTHFYVMDYIAGRPLDAYAASTNMILPEKLLLFAKISDAVNAAHLRGVIHRDLKPSNIRIDADGEPHVLDFGLARNLAADAAGQQTMTAAGEFIGSLPWASPEQVQGIPEKVDLRTDVYSLGVMLYHLLTGQFPYRVVGSMHDVLDDILRAEPPRPSSLRRELNSEVDTIVLKCLHKERERRYQTAGELAREIRNYLDGKPLEARRDSQWYVLSKTVRRHWLAVSIAALAAVLILVATIAMSVLYRQADASASVARGEADKSQQIQTFLEWMLASANPRSSKSADLSVREMLDNAAQRIEADFQERPLLEASLHNTIGNSYSSLGLYDKAEAHLQHALDIRREQYGSVHADLAESANNLGVLLKLKGDYAAAEPLYREALHINRQLYDGDHAHIAFSLNNLAAVLRRKGHNADAEALYRESLAMRRRLFGDDHQEVANCMNNLAVLLRSQGKYQEAEQLYREALDILIRLHGREHADVAQAMDNLAHALHSLGKKEAAESFLREGLSIRRKTLGATHPDVAFSLNNLAVFLKQQGEFEQAEEFYRQCLDIRRAALGDEHPETAQTLNNLGSLMLAKKRYAEAEQLFRQALAARRNIFGERHRLVASTLHNLARVQTAQGNLPEARSLAQQALALRRELLPPTHPDLATSLEQLARVLQEEGEFAEAVLLLRQALEIREQALPSGHKYTMRNRIRLGACLVRLEHFDEAEALLLEALNNAHQKSKTGELSQSALTALADLYLAWGKSAEAAQYRAQLTPPQGPSEQPSH